jgi:hypothetical protein
MPAATAAAGRARAALQLSFQRNSRAHTLGRPLGDSPSGHPVLGTRGGCSACPLSHRGNGRLSLSHAPGALPGLGRAILPLAPGRKQKLGQPPEQLETARFSCRGRCTPHSPTARGGPSGLSQRHRRKSLTRATRGQRSPSDRTPPLVPAAPGSRTLAGRQNAPQRHSACGRHPALARTSARGRRAGLGGAAPRARQGLSADCCATLRLGVGAVLPARAQHGTSRSLHSPAAPSRGAAPHRGRSAPAWLNAAAGALLPARPRHGAARTYLALAAAPPPRTPPHRPKAQRLARITGADWEAQRATAALGLRGVTRPRVRLCGRRASAPHQGRSSDSQPAAATAPWSAARALVPARRHALPAA